MIISLAVCRLGSVTVVYGRSDFVLLSILILLISHLENNDSVTCVFMVLFRNQRLLFCSEKYALIIFSAQLITLRGIFMLTLKRVHGYGLVGAVQNKRTHWRSMFWTLLVTRVVRARSYETTHLIGTLCVTYIAYIHEVMNDVSCYDIML